MNQSIEDKLLIEFNKSLILQELFGIFLHDNKHLMSRLFMNVSDLKNTALNLTEINPYITSRIDNIQNICIELDDNFKKITDFYRIREENNVYKIRIIDIINDIKVLFRHKLSPAINLSIRGIKHDSTIIGNPSLIKLCLINIIDNSVDSLKYTEDKKIEIKFEQTKKSSIIEVIDNGQGIATDYLNVITNPFFSTKENSVGIGLTISKKIIEQYHDGQMILHSEKGKSFRVQIILKNR